MYELYKKGDEWEIHATNEAYAGSFKMVISYCISTLAIDSAQLEAAVSDMMQKDHNAAHFGLYKQFIYSFIKEFKKAG